MINDAKKIIIDESDHMLLSSLNVTIGRILPPSSAGSSLPMTWRGNLRSGRLLEAAKNGET